MADDRWGDRGILRDNIPIFLCSFTKNPSGTDTWAIGRPCQCDGCRAHLGVEALRADLAESATELRRLRKIEAAVVDAERAHAKIEKDRQRPPGCTCDGYMGVFRWVHDAHNCAVGDAEREARRTGDGSGT